MINAIVLDIDETLLFALGEPNISSAVKKKLGGELFWVQTRDGVQELITYCTTNNILIIVFSAGQINYVKDCVKLLKIPCATIPYTNLPAIYSRRCLEMGRKTLGTILEDFPDLTYGNIMTVDDVPEHFPDALHVYYITKFRGTQDRELFSVIDRLKLHNQDRVA